MKVDISKLSIKDLAHYICDLLTKNKIDVVLVGGACVSIYSKNKYMSYDLDFVTSKTLNEIEPVLKTIGFTRLGRIFKNEKCDYVIDFVAYPVMIGQEQTKEFEIIKTKHGQLNLLRPVDSIKDRLAGYFYWNDPQSLEQAIMIFKAQKNKIDLEEIETWAKQENNIEKFNIFVKEINK
ncbi:MAG: hypothetical protein II816_04975 [Elusimicrobia bacterium]|nr:hypothetical protein [Elusimicrobiota bacterium]